MTLFTDLATFISSPQGIVVSLPALAVGLWLLVKGLIAFRDEARVGDVATSNVATLAAGEVRLSGVIEGAEMVLVSALQSRPCVYYRSRIRDERGDGRRDLLDEQQAISFRLRDSSGAIRVVPRGRVDWNVPERWSETTDIAGGDPPGLERRRGASTTAAELDREVAIAALLTVRSPEPISDDGGDPGLLGDLGLAGSSDRGRRYSEARLEPGETVTIVGMARPYRDLQAELIAPVPDDADLAAALDAARASGRLATTPEDAWGNAAIPGFGIGQPTRPPELDPDADAPRVPTPAEAAAAESAAEARFEIAPDELVIGQPDGDGQLVVYPGTPAEAVERERTTLLVGLLGAVLAIGAGMLLAVQLSGVLA
ncbi:MAG TPA: hypothetical protein VIF84_02680 [Candidatus Limnocylindrales bacterium]